MGYGGQCAKLTPPRSYWCQPDGRVAGHTYFVRTPAGIAKATSHLPHAPYKGGAPNATVFYWRPGHWFSVMYELAGPINASTGDIVFGHGGFQGAEGHDTVAEWYVISSGWLPHKPCHVRSACCGEPCCGRETYVIFFP